MKTSSFWAGIVVVAYGSGALAQNPPARVQSFHAELGELVDAQENAHYNLFGAISGFSAARLYAGYGQNGEKDFVLHILKNDSASAQWLKLIFTPEAYPQFIARIHRRVQAVARGESAPTQPVYAIADEAWQSRKILKRVTLRDGSVLNAALLRAQTDTLFVQTAGGVQAAIADEQIEAIEDMPGEIVHGLYYREDPNGTRLFLAPTGRGLKSGQAYFADYFLFFPTLAVGITDNIALSGGVSLVPGASSQLAYFGPKVSFPITSYASFSTGLLYIVIPEDTDDATLTYAVGTIGSKRNSITLGLGLPFTSDGESHPVLLVGGEVQVSSGTKLLTENWLFTERDAPFLFSAGVRFFGEKLAVDVALVSSEEFWSGEGFPFIPWVDFSVFFGK